MSGGEGFGTRWSRLKSADRRRIAVEPPSDVEPPAADANVAAPPRGVESTDTEAPPPADLPALDSLTKDSDFSPFLRPGVPEDLKLAALRKLWASDPVWAAPERLDLHNLDYTWPSIPEIVRTAYRVGQGFCEPAAAPPESATHQIGAAAPAKLPAEPSPTSDKNNTQKDHRLVDQKPSVGCNEDDESSS